MSCAISCLGIESTAHTFGVGVSTSRGEILANENKSYVPTEGGIHPREAAQQHSAVAVDVLSSALRVSGIEPASLDVIAFSQGPGLGPCLRTGATVARVLSLLLGRPLVGVNHSLAHIEIGRLICSCQDPLTLYVSGGNTMIAAFEGGRYRVFGETLDISANNCLDSFAIQAGLGFPANVKVHPVEQKATKGGKLLDIPYIVKGMDVSFSGILTASIKLLSQGKDPEDVCFTLVEVVYGMLTEVTERALAHTEKKEVLLTGGGARSERLQRSLRQICQTHGASLHVVPPQYAGDNGAMISWNGLLHYRHGDTIEVAESVVKPRMRIEEVEATWREGSPHH